MRYYATLRVAGDPCLFFAMVCRTYRGSHPDPRKKNRPLGRFSKFGGGPGMDSSAVASRVLTPLGRLHAAHSGVQTLP